MYWKKALKAGKCAVAVPVIIDAGTEARNSMMGKQSVFAGRRLS